METRKTHEKILTRDLNPRQRRESRSRFPDASPSPALGLVMSYEHKILQF